MKNGEGTIYFTLDGSDPRQVTIESDDTLVAFDEVRTYHVPTSVDDGFLLSPPLSVAPIARYNLRQRRHRQCAGRRGAECKL